MKLLVASLVVLVLCGTAFGWTGWSHRDQVPKQFLLDAADGIAASGNAQEPASVYIIGNFVD
jgi:hypothetical protein